MVEECPVDVHPLEPARILIVDDDREQAEALTLAFRRQGYGVVAAHTVEQTWRCVQTEPPQLIILDIQLPDGDGLNVCRRLTDDLETCEIPVILLSGTERPDIIRNARAAGCHYFLRKPYDPNALLLLAESALGERRGW
jgi:CheY-like chemotaxis protein